MPAIYIDYESAVQFCDRVSELEGAEYRLPTEAEWEYACRAGSDTLYCFGDSPSELGEYATYSKNTRSRFGPIAVGQKRPNAFGLFDLHGNVAEYCRDWFDPDSYHSAGTVRDLVVDPTGPRVSPTDQRVLRGGNWQSAPEWCRSGYRDAVGPSAKRFGFRVVREINWTEK